MTLSRKTFNGPTITVILLLLISCAFLSFIIPPLQSPDEQDHIERAYLLGKGVFILDRPEKQSSGGSIDTGLLTYLTSYLSIKDNLSEEEIQSATNVRWTGHRVYDPSPGTGYYFPIIYIPQSAGLLIGESLGLTVDHSYRLARAFSLAVIGLLLFAAFSLYPASPLLLALIAMPMSLFQFSSASLDGVSTALAVFSIAAFLRIAKDKHFANNWIQYALAAATVVVTTSRIHTLPLVLLLGAVFFYTKSKKSLILFMISMLFIVAWTLIAVITTADLRVKTSDSTLNVIILYLQNPLRVFSIIWETVLDPNFKYFYYSSFIGVLGWLDARFRHEYYIYFGIAILFIAVFSISLKGFRDEWPSRLLLISTSLLSIFFIFFALLVTWTPYPTSKVFGVQGRYFLIPMILLTYGIVGHRELLDGWRRQVATLTCLIFLIFSVAASTNLLLHRYYLTPFKFEVEEITFHSPNINIRRHIIPSIPLKLDSPIILNIPRLDKNDFGKTVRIGVMIGTYMRKNTGTAKVILKTKEGNTFHQEFSLQDLNDNTYKFFKVPADIYVAGEIRFVSGGGISVWESHTDDGEMLTCVRLMSTLNKKLTIPSCP